MSPKMSPYREVEAKAAAAREAARPDLQGLVEAHGGYHRITPEAWAEFRQRMADWERSVWCGEFWPKGAQREFCLRRKRK